MGNKYTEVKAHGLRVMINGQDISNFIGMVETWASPSGVGAVSITTEQLHALADFLLQKSMEPVRFIMEEGTYPVPGMVELRGGGAQQFMVHGLVFGLDQNTGEGYASVYCDPVPGVSDGLLQFWDYPLRFRPAAKLVK